MPTPSSSPISSKSAPRSLRRQIIFRPNLAEEHSLEFRVDKRKSHLAVASSLWFQRQFLAEWTGLEPATPGVTGRYSNQLNYHSAVVN